MATKDLPNYFHHEQRTAIGPSLGISFNDMTAATSECENMGYNCAGFAVDAATSTYQLVPRGYSLAVDDGSEFYRKKNDPTVSADRREACGKRRTSGFHTLCRPTTVGRDSCPLLHPTPSPFVVHAHLCHTPRWSSTFS